MQHALTEFRRASDHRKMVRCTVCQQEWTAHPRIRCPGVPVKPWSKEHGTLRTATQAKKEHYLLPDDAKPVAALRLDKDPWYLWLYDVSGVEQKLATEAQKAAHARREQTMRERYGCKFCTKRYGKKDAEDHVNGICWECRNRARQWNVRLEWARELVSDPPIILALETTPKARAMRLPAPGGPWSVYQLVGYQSYEFVSGEEIARYIASDAASYAPVAGLLHFAETAGTKKPLFLFASEGDQDLFITQMRQRSPQASRSAYQLTTCLHMHERLLIPTAEKTWLEFPRDQEQSRYYRELCKRLSLAVAPDASVVEMLRLVVQDLAKREEIEL